MGNHRGQTISPSENVNPQLQDEGSVEGEPDSVTATGQHDGPTPRHTATREPGHTRTGDRGKKQVPPHKSTRSLHETNKNAFGRQPAQLFLELSRRATSLDTAISLGWLVGA